MYDNSNTLSTSSFKEGALENRELLMQFAFSNEMKIINKMYKKNATYRIVKELGNITCEQIDNKTHAQIDSIFVNIIWRNSITNAETHTRANINSDHFPLVFTIRLKLRHMNKGGKTRPQYKPCDSTQQDDLNYELWNAIPENTEEDSYKVIRNWLEQGTDSLPRAIQTDKNKRYEPSYTSKDVPNQRKETAKARNPQLVLQLSKQCLKSRRDDKRTGTLEALSKDLDIRERWLGIRELKRKFNPTPFHNKTAQGQHIQHKERAQEAAKYPSTIQWGTNLDTATQEIDETQIIQPNTEQYNIDYPTLAEIYRAIRKLKRRKAPGPDDTPTELLKELKEDNATNTKLFEKWWNYEHINTEEQKARVVLIYKKGDANKFENYRPISLPSTLYKIFAATLHKNSKQP
jgi:hypothetical protein